jgi:YidC/Oxa1 family membrane protein insertase
MVRYLDNNPGFNSWLSAQESNKKKSKFTGFLWWAVIFLLAWWLFSAWLAPERGAERAAPGADVENVSDDEKNSAFITRFGGDKLHFYLQGSRVFKIELDDYSETKGADRKITLLSGENEFAEVGLLANGTNAPTATTQWKQVSKGVYRENMRWKNSDGVDFYRVVSVQFDNPDKELLEESDFTGSRNYIITFTDTIKNNSGRDFSVSPYARIVRLAGADSMGVAAGGIAFANGGIERESWKSVGKKSHAWTTSGGFAGFEEQYWQTIVSLDSPDQTIKVKPLSKGRLQAEASSAPIAVPAGKSVVLTTNLFAGPKTPEALKSAAAVIPGMDRTIDYGWFWFLAQPFLWALNALYSLVLNYGAAIILLTIDMRILMWPLTRKSFQGMAAMQSMQPEMQRIQKLYANDKMRMQAEMLRLYKDKKTSPMSGCLPMLLQIPIFFALYKALLIAVPLRHAGFLWISDLTVMDPYFILPVLMGATMWWQQRMQSPGAGSAVRNDPMAQTQRMMKWMPLLFTVLFAWMPAGLVLYWTVSNLFGIGQMWWIKKH